MIVFCCHWDPDSVTVTYKQNAWELFLDNEGQDQVRLGTHMVLGVVIIVCTEYDLWCLLPLLANV